MFENWVIHQMFLNKYFPGGGEGSTARPGESSAEDSLPAVQCEGQRLRLQQWRQGLLQHPGRGAGVACGDRVQADIPQRQGNLHSVNSHNSNPYRVAQAWFSWLNWVFQGSAVVKQPRKAQKLEKIGSHIKFRLWNPLLPCLWSSPDFCWCELN